MKRKHGVLAGNMLMGIGLFTMIVAVACIILDHLPQINFPQYALHSAVFGIFMGALLWLAGARMSTTENIADRYYWLRHYGDKRCRRITRHSSQ